MATEYFKGNKPDFCNPFLLDLSPKYKKKAR